MDPCLILASLHSLQALPFWWEHWEQQRTWMTAASGPLGQLPFCLPRTGLFHLQSLTGCRQRLQGEQHPNLTRLLGTPRSNGLQQCVPHQWGITGCTPFLQTVNPVSTRLWVRLLWPHECAAGGGPGLYHATAMGQQSCGGCWVLWAPLRPAGWKGILLGGVTHYCASRYLEYTGHSVCETGHLQGFGRKSVWW